VTDERHARRTRQSVCIAFIHSLSTPLHSCTIAIYTHPAARTA
jgi:hypothetical protein